MTKIMSDEELRRLRRSVFVVWDCIAPDVEPLVSTNADAIELCIDAGRLLEFAEDADSHGLVQRLAAAGKYSALLRLLNKECAIV